MLKTAKTKSRNTKGLPLMVKARPQSADFIRNTSRARRLTNTAVIDILVDGFHQLTPEQQARLFGDGGAA